MRHIILGQLHYLRNTCLIICTEKRFPVCHYEIAPFTIFEIRIHRRIQLRILIELYDLTVIVLYYTRIDSAAADCTGRIYVRQKTDLDSRNVSDSGYSARNITVFIHFYIAQAHGSELIVQRLQKRKLFLLRAGESNAFGIGLCVCFYIFKKSFKKFIHIILRYFLRLLFFYFPYY